MPGPLGPQGGFGGTGSPPKSRGGLGGIVPPKQQGEAVTPEQQPISQPQRIDRYIGQYAERAVGMVASEIRALFAVAARPDIESPAGGGPHNSAVPLIVVVHLIGPVRAR